MKNISLSVPAGPGLGGANLVEMKRDELREVEGGFLIGIAIRVYIASLRGRSMSEIAPLEEWESGTTGVTSSFPF